MPITVNGEMIEDSEIQQELERMRPRYEQVFADMDAQERAAQLLDWSKENVIERVLLRQQAKNNGPQIPASQVDEALAKLKEQYEDQQQLYKDLDVEDDAQARQVIELQMKVERQLDAVTGELPKPTKAQIEQYYQENQEKFRTPEQIRIAHIVKYVNWHSDESTALEQITKAHEELGKGAPFEAIVNRYTDCGDNGGDLGYVAHGQMVEEFEDVVFNLAPGQVSEIFRTRFGFHIAKVYDRKPSGVAELDQVKSQVLDELTEQLREQAVNDYLDGLRAKATIEQA